MKLLKSAWFWVASMGAMVLMVLGWVTRRTWLQSRALAQLTGRQAKYSDERAKAEANRALAARSSDRAEKHLAKAGRHADDAAMAREAALSGLGLLREARDRDDFVATFNRLSGPAVRDVEPTRPSPGSTGPGREDGSQGR